MDLDYCIQKHFHTPFKLGGGTMDAPDKRDHIDKLPKGRLKLPRRVSNLEKGGKQYRSNTGTFLGFPAQDRGGCTSWGFEIVKTLTNLCLHGETISHDSRLHWLKQCMEYDASASKAASLLSSLKIGLKYTQAFPFSEYVRLPKGDLQHLKVRLAMGFSMLCGVRWKMTPDGKSNTYKTTLETGVWRWYPTRAITGHCVAITGYNDDTGLLEITESLQMAWGGKSIKGVFYVPYEEYEHMMSAYLIRDMRDGE